MFVSGQVIQYEVFDFVEGNWFVENCYVLWQFLLLDGGVVNGVDGNYVYL